MSGQATPGNNTEPTTEQETPQEEPTTPAEPTPEGERTFTQEQLNSILANAKHEWRKQLDELTQQVEDLRPLKDKVAEEAQARHDAEEAKKTEVQRLAEQLEALRADNETRRHSEARHKVAADTGVPAELLSGADEDEMRATAQALIDFASGRADTAAAKAAEEAAAKARADAKPPADAPPKEQLTGGASAITTTDRDALLARIRNRKR